MKVPQIGGTQREIRGHLLGRCLNGVLQHGDCLGRFPAAQVVVSHLDGQTGIGGIKSERLAVTVERLLWPVALFLEKAVHKPRQSVRLPLPLGIERSRRLRYIGREHVGNGTKRRKVGQRESSTRKKEEDLPSSATGSLESSLPTHARKCNS